MVRPSRIVVAIPLIVLASWAALEAQVQLTPPSLGERPNLLKPDLACSIEVWNEADNSAVQPGSNPRGLSFRATVFVHLQGKEALSDVKATANWAIIDFGGTNWQLPVPKQQTLASIPPSKPVKVQTFSMSTPQTPFMLGLKVVAAVDTAGSVAESNETNNECSFQFTRIW